MSLKAIESAEMILRNIEFKFSEDSKAKSSSNVPPIFFFQIINYIIFNIAIFYFIVVIKNKNKNANKQ